MKISDFRIGLAFLGASGVWYRCTDVGKRTIVAIRLCHDDPVWYQGPPYIVREVVFDESQLGTCYPNDLALLEGRLAQARYSAHPGIRASDYVRMVDERSGRSTYPYPDLFRFDRVLDNGEILHPYSARMDEEEDDGTWYIRIFLLFPRAYIEMPELDFIRLPIATEEDLQHRKDALLEQRKRIGPKASS
jgi:hypothetical protein